MAAPKANSQIPLKAGDRLDQKTFHARYEAMPEHVKAELIEGVVYMPSPLKWEHGDVHGEVLTWLKLYKAATPGTRVGDNATTIMGPQSEPQPDACLILLPGIWRPIAHKQQRLPRRYSGAARRGLQQ